MRLSIFALGLVALSMLGCSSRDDCEGIACEPCPPAIQIDIRAVDRSGPPVVTGPVALSCDPWPGGWVCYATTAPLGAHAFDVTLAGETRSVTVTVVEGGGTCCSCPTDSEVGQVSFEAPGGDGGVACDPARVEFPMGGALEAGTLCDDVFACVPEAAAASVEAATVFECPSEPAGFVCDAGERACRYAPSTLDAAELANVCALTVHAPPPTRMVCRVYL